MEPIAIIGLGCRFPGAADPQAFWQLLRTGRDAITEVPDDRWDIEAYYDRHLSSPGKMNTRWAGFLDQIDGFDADFFGMTADEAEHTDPQQRLFLEVAWEALEHAGIVPTELAGSQTGVFVGLCTIDYHRLLYKDFACIGPYSGTGTTPCITANRLSYLLDLRGPSLSIDAACASSLVTVHLACQSLNSGESDLCLAGGVNLILSPDSTIASSQTRLLSTEGRCKPFDANADGYVRGEGCGVVVLKRLADARRDGDTVLALIRGSAINQDGLSNSLTAPNGLAQQALIRQALKNGNVQPAEISYVEAHAVGTSIGDAIEFKALKTVLMEGRAADRFAKPPEAEHSCWLGSAKPNIGHLEAASGVAALIKVVLSLQQEEIPPHLHVEQLNPYVSLENTPFLIPTEVQKWSRGTEKRFAGISAFGFGGTNAHLVLEEAPIPVSQQSIVEPPLHLFTLSAKSDAALAELARRYESFLSTSEQLSLADLCFTTHRGRSHFDHRLCIVTRSLSQLQQQLKAFGRQKTTPGLFQGKIKGRKRPQVLFVFPDNASDFTSSNFTVGWSLYQTQPTFRQAFDRCAELLQLALKIPDADYPLSLLQSVPPCPLAQFALSYALAELWRSWGVTPKAVAGNGVGEYAAAAIAGILSLEDAVELVVERTRLLQDPFGAEKGSASFTEIAHSLSYSQPRIPLISSRTGKAIAQIALTPDYWIQQLQQDESINSEVLAAYNLSLEMNLHSSRSIAADKHEGRECQEPADWYNLLSQLAVLYVQGSAIDWSGFHRHDFHHRLPLPTYSFQRKRYWFKSCEEISELSDRSGDRLSVDQAQSFTASH